MPVDRQIIEQQLAAIGEIDRWWNNAEARVLPDILGSEERILSIANGRLHERIRRSRSWLIVVTTHRLIALRDGNRLGRHQLEVPASEIGSVSHSTGVVRTTVTLATPERKYRIRVQKRDVTRLVSALSSLMNQRPARRAAAAGQPEEHAELLPVYDRIEMLEDEITRMRDQIDFMENLLRRRIPDLPRLEDAGAGPALPSSTQT
jgi:hypothetical protein